MRPVPKFVIGKASPISLELLPTDPLAPFPRRPFALFPQHLTVPLSMMAQVDWKVMARLFEPMSPVSNVMSCMSTPTDRSAPSTLGVMVRYAVESQIEVWKVMPFTVAVTL